MKAHWWHYPVGVFLAARLSLVAFAYLLLHVGIDDPAHTHLGGMLGQFCEWDCLILRDLATSGYTDYISTNFFPGYLLLTRGLHALTPGLDVAVTMVVIANAASLLSFVVLDRLFTALADEAGARVALALFAFYPFAFFQASGYPESLAILFTAAAVYASLRDRPAPAGLALAAAVVVRHVTALAGLSLLAFEYSHSGPRLWRRARTYWLLLPLLSLSAYCTYCALRFGNPVSFLVARSNWGNNAWRGIDAGVLTGHSPQYTLFRAYLLIALPLAAGAVALVRTPRWRNVGYYGASLMAVICLVGIYALGRYSASCWPAFLPLGVWLSRRPALAMCTVGACAVLQSVFFFLHTHQAVVL